MSRVKTLKCLECQTDFEILQKEYNRQIKKGRANNHFFCSLSCTATYNNRVSSRGNVKNFGDKAYKGDEYTPFRFYLRKTHGTKKHECDIDLQYLKQLWEQQDGKCALTGIPMTPRLLKGNSCPTTASLDRIDSTQGYVKNNVQFVCCSINLAKNNYTQTEILSFIDMIRNNHHSTSK